MARWRWRCLSAASRSRSLAGVFVPGRCSSCSDATMSPLMPSGRPTSSGYYPDVWADRHYSERSCLAALLLADQRRYEIVLPNTFVSRDPTLSAILAPLWQHASLAGAEPHGVSFWLRVRERA